MTISGEQHRQLTDDADRLRRQFREQFTDSAIAQIAAQPTFGPAALAGLNSWGPNVGDNAAITRRLLDIGHMMAAMTALAMDASPEGLTHASLSRHLTLLGLSSRGRVSGLLVYLQFVGMITASPRPDDGAARRYRPTPSLVQQFRARYRRELTAAAPVAPSARDLLAVWDEPGRFEAFVIAHNRFLAAAFREYDRSRTTLNVFSERNGGLIVLGQLMVIADDGSGCFPPRGPARVSLRELGRLSGFPHGQVRRILRAGEAAGFLDLQTEGEIAFCGDLDRHLILLMAGHFFMLDECARQALSISTDG